MNFRLQLAIWLSVLVAAVWTNPLEHDVRAANSSTAAANSTLTATPTKQSASSVHLSSSNLTIASSTAMPLVNNSLPQLAMPLLASDDGDNQTQTAEYAKTCHRIDEKSFAQDGNFVFCQPIHLQNVTAKEIYPFIWDSRFFDANATNVISLNYVEDPDNVPLISAINIPNSRGYALIAMAEKWLRDGKSNNLTVFITSSHKGNNKTISGPTVVLIPNKDSSSKKEPSKVGLGVGIPFAFGAVAIFALGAFLCIRKRRRASKGYPASKSHDRGAMQVEDDDFIGGTSGPSRFRDDPYGGVELQDRSRGHRREESLGSLTSSPTEDFGGQREGRSNAFRDEISRQRTLRA